jgi:hypothetical protein
MRSPSQVNLILNYQDKKFALELYEETLLLPLTETELYLNKQGYYMDRSLRENNENLVICFKRTKPCLLKTLNPREADRMQAILPRLKVDDKMISNYIVEMDIVSVQYKTFAIMPLMPATLKQLQIRQPEVAIQLYIQMKSALLALHSNGSQNII